MGAIGMQEMILVFVVALLVFGPKKLPELGKSLGKGLREFKRATNELKSTFDDQLRDVDREVRETKRDLRDVEKDLKKDLEQDQASAVPPADRDPVGTPTPSPEASADPIGQGSIMPPVEEGEAPEPEPEPVTSDTPEVPESPADAGTPPSGTPA